METIKTTLHAYEFNLHDPDQRAAYKDLCNKLRERGMRCTEFVSTDGHTHHRNHIKPLDGCEITLELRHVFDNQWNTAPTETSDKGLRVFDWTQSYLPHNEKYKAGHYLDVTAEMQAIRDNTNACGYCGYQTRAQRGDVFCPQCLDSEYLKASDLHLTRMQAVSAGHKRAALSEAEREHLLPLYRQAQIHGTTERGKRRAADRRRRVIEKHAKTTENAENERDGFLWLLDNGINVDNVIYYDHIGQFCFGWRKPVDDELRSELLNIISEFRWPYEIRCANGDKLQGNVG